MPESCNNRIMIIDDTPANLDLLYGILKKEGYDLVQFPRGTMALKPARTNPPDLILLDVMMPEMDGYEVCRKLKEAEETKDIPIIFLSALGDAQDKIRAFQAGGVDYVTKPFQPDEVVARVGTHLQIANLQRELNRYNHELKLLVEEKVQEVSDSQLATLQAITSLGEFRDEDTGMHLNRTSRYCEIIARQLKKNSSYSGQIDELFIGDLVKAAPLHDVGKIGIPDNILLKKGSLTDDEFTIMQNHVHIGVATLKRVLDRYQKNSFIDMGVKLTGSHHEKWDGSGYPKGLSGEAIPLAGRIMALADVYDALRSRRSYKESFDHEKSMAIIIEERGRHFDPVVVDAFLAVEQTFEQINEDMKDC